VGPRPHALGSTAEGKLFWQVDHLYWRRHRVKPGITGLAQKRGYRGATDREEQLVNRLRSDLEYIDNWSLLGDIMIILGTLRVLVHRNAF
jgi:polysaccharide biosynthesis protein PslA